MTARFQAKIAVWQKRLEQIHWTTDRTPTVLVRPNLSSSGRAHYANGVVDVSIRPVTVFPDDVAFAVLVHERTHLHLASEVRQAILRRHSDIDTFFHERLLPDIIGGKVSSVSRSSSDLAKHIWRELYSETPESEPFDWHHCAAYIDWIFERVRSGERLPTEDNLGPVEEIAARCPSETVTQMDSTRTVEELYAQNPRQYAEEVLTAYGLADDLFTRYKKTYGVPFGIGSLDMIRIEEHFANYVACAATGLSMHEIDQWAPQDPWKLDKVPRLLEKFPAFEELLERVHSVPSLLAFGRETGVV